MLDLIAGIDQLATDAKRGTEHETCDGWRFPHRPRALFCGCGAVLVDSNTIERTT